MIRFIEPEELDGRSGEHRPFRLVDPRRRMRYLSGHLPGAINVPAVGALDEKGRLLPPEALAAWLGSSGVGTDMPVVLYDGYDGQLGSLISWILQYLGHPDVRFLRIGYETWKAAGRPVLYRPVQASPAPFEPNPQDAVRASRSDVSAPSDSVILDVRSEGEYRGEQPGDLPPGHIPGAVSVPWVEFVQREGDLFVAPEAVRGLLADAGVATDQEIITYCRTGPRAAVAWMALRRAGLPVRLYDGSYMDWTTAVAGPVER